MSIESDIVDKIVQIVAAVPGINTVNFDEVRLGVEDFEEHELSAIQIWDNGQTITHQRQRSLVDWALSLELIMKSDINNVVNQKALFEKRREIVLALFDKPNLGIPGMTHLYYTGNISDLHLVNPYYIARIDMTAQFYDQLTGTC